MKISATRRSSRIPSCAVLAALVAAGLLPQGLSAQFFGRNKVQYESFDFRVLETRHYDIHFYPVEEEVATDMARSAERWHERFARLFQHEFEQPKPIIFYADHPDFQQTNTLSGFIGEGTGGVTESLKNRVILPFTGSYYQNDHVLGHELVHAFQYNIAQSRQGGGINGLARLPLWLIEGMAEYLSIGREDTHTAMWMRDAILNNDLPTIRDMSREARFFPYRFGQALWAYVGGTYGDRAVADLFRRSIQIGWDPAVRQILAISSEELSVEWRKALEETYIPVMEGRTAPSQLGSLIIGSETGGGRFNVGPSVSPDGRYLAFLSERDLFSIDLYLADATTGRIIRKLQSADRDPHFDALRSIDSSGSWSPDGSRFVFSVFAGGDQELVIISVDGDTRQRIRIPGLGSVSNPAWSPDGGSIAFTGYRGGISDLYVYDLETRQTRQLTNDKHADFHPTWSPDGATIAFTTDRGPGTDFQRLTYGPLRLALIDVESGNVQTLDTFTSGKQINPQFSPGGESLYFISDQDGFSDLYRIRLTDGRVSRVTRLATGVSGITGEAPALSVARETGTILFSVFDQLEYRIHRLEADEVQAVPVSQDPEGGLARRLPPADPADSRVAEYLADWSTGLPEEEEYTPEEIAGYDPDLSLDYVGQPTIGVGTDRFGNYFGGGAFAIFSDMLGNRTLGVSLQAQGTLKDIGGQAFFENRKNRLNWGVEGGRIPFLRVFAQRRPVNDGQTIEIAQVRDRIFVDYVSSFASYPLSTTRRFEGSLGLTRYSYDREIESFFFENGRLVGRSLTDADAPDPLNFAQGSLAYVGDNSIFGFTSPIRGGRFRLEAEQTLGTLDFTTALADYRRYFSPDRNLTIAVRGLHVGRYGLDPDDNQRLSPFFLGYETLVRGYSFESFVDSGSECGSGAGGTTECPVFDRLSGNKIGVFNLEARVPILGVEEFGVFTFPYLPTELSAFLDAGVAYNESDASDVEFVFERDAPVRVPVVSAGVSARFNIFGYLVFETYWAYPFQRPDKGGHFGFQVAPGW